MYWFKWLQFFDTKKDTVKSKYLLVQSHTSHCDTKLHVTHPINVAILLSEMEASEEVVIAGLLHDIILEKTNMSLEEVRKEFSDRIVNIIKGVTKFNGNTDMKDEDVIMVKLAERLHNMRTIEFMDEIRWKEKAKETLDIFSPIAAKLNNEKLVAELNDLSVKYI